MRIKLFHIMENFHDLLIKRRSTRKFTEEPLTPEEVTTILQAALLSPAGKSKNPWQFIVVEDKEVLERLSYAKQHGAALIKGASLAIVVLAEPMISDTWIEDASIASTLIQLQCEDLGLGSCWVQIRNRTTEAGQDADEAVRAILDIPYTVEVLSIIAIGRKNEEKKPHDTDKLQWEKVHIGKW